MYFISDNVGGNNPSAAKTECAFKTLTRLQNAKVPVDGLGIQSHYSARPGSFPTKASAHETLDKLKSMGLLGAITEMDIWVPDLSKEAERYQASIFGDILDTCLYSSNCNEVSGADVSLDAKIADAADSVLISAIHHCSLHSSSYGTPGMTNHGLTTSLLSRLTR